MVEILNRVLDPEKTKADFRRVVWFYDVWSRLTESKAAKRVLELADIHDGEAVLEVACGTGAVFEKIVWRNPNGVNLGIDLSADMLDKARQRMKKTGKHNYELGYGDALSLDFADGQFDLVVNNFMIDLMPYDAFDKIAQELFRVTRPGGRVLVSHFSFGRKKINRFWYWIAKYFPGLLTGCRPVSLKGNLVNAGFVIDTALEISQNTFPSEVIKAGKIQTQYV